MKYRSFENSIVSPVHTGSPHIMPHKVGPCLNIMLMGPLRFSKGYLEVTFSRPFLLLDKLKLTNSWKGLVNVTL